jgi:hypothetical protein
MEHKKLLIRWRRIIYQHSTPIITFKSMVLNLGIILSWSRKRCSNTTNPDRSTCIASLITSDIPKELHNSLAISHSNKRCFTSSGAYKQIGYCPLVPIWRLTRIDFRGGGGGVNPANVRQRSFLFYWRLLDAKQSSKQGSTPKYQEGPTDLYRVQTCVSIEDGILSGPSSVHSYDNSMQ